MQKGQHPSNIFTLPPPGTRLKFRNQKNSLRCPVVVYADFESVLKPRNQKHKQVQIFQEHEACAVGWKVVCSPQVLQLHPGLAHSYQSIDGADCVLQFLEKMFELEAQVVEIVRDDQPMQMDEEQRRLVEETNFICHVCGKPCFTIDANGAQIMDRVFDHDHLTGQFRGVAHNRCNLALRKQYQLPVFFHNLKGYDGHFIARAFNEPQFQTKKLTAIGQSMQKYMMLKAGDHLVFKDSLQFLSASLDSLARNLKVDGIDRFGHLRSDFPGLSPEQLDLVSTKGM